MSDEGERRIPGTLEEDSETEEVPATTSVPETPPIDLPARNYRGCHIIRPPVRDPSAPPPPLAPTPTSPPVQTPPSFPLSTTALSYLATPVRNLFTYKTMSTQTGEASTDPRPDPTNTNPSDIKGKRPANPNQHSNPSKCGYALSY